MSRKLPFTFLGVLLLTLGISSSHLPKKTVKPNILIILADDLGYSDLGCYGGEIATPNLDFLAKNGLRFTQFYNTGRCWPSRAALLTGYYAQQIRRDKIDGVKPSGAGGKRPTWAPLLAELLQLEGYRNYHSGKWHIDGMPIENGFDRSYYLKDQGRFFNPKVHWEDDVPLPPVQPGTDYYATTAIANHAIKCLKEHEKKYSNRPFFHFLPFTAPHFPLHAKQEDIERYKKIYKKDWGKIRKARFKRQKRIGIISHDLSEVERDVGPPYHFPEALEILGPGEVNRPLLWKTLTKEQQRFQLTKMAIHAAMVDRMDIEIGRVIDQLRIMGAFENTLILFLSDNGASAEIMVRSDGHDPTASPGSAASYLCLGPGFSTTSNTPFRRHKTWVHEGGVSTPFIVHWPMGFDAKGELRHNPGHVIDVVPTIMEIIGTSLPVNWKNEAVPPAPGISLVPAFTQDRSVERDYLWWSHEGNCALRVGRWKLVKAKDMKNWELFDLENDRTETTNLADSLPEKVIEMEKMWEERQDAFMELAIKDLK